MHCAFVNRELLCYVSDSGTVFLASIIVFRLPHLTLHSHRSPGLLEMMKISYYTCICDGKLMSKSFEMDQNIYESVLVISKCILVKMLNVTVGVVI